MLYINVLLNLPSIDGRLMDLGSCHIFLWQKKICCFYGMNVKELILCTIYTNIFPAKKGHRSPGKLVSQMLVLLIFVVAKSTR